MSPPTLQYSNSNVRTKDLHAVAAAVTKAPPGGSTLVPSMFNLAKSILGAGILSLPSGVAAFSDETSSLYISSVMLLFMGIVSAYSFSSIGQACALHNSKTFSDAYQKSVKKSSKTLSTAITFKTFFTCLAYSIIIGDSFSQLFQSLGLPPILSGRTNVILILSTVVIFPLCLLKNLESLKYSSIVGILGVVYCAIFMGIRYLDGSYRPGGEFFSSIKEGMKPSFNNKGTVIDNSIFVLLSMMSTAYVAHYNAPKFYAGLDKPSMSRFNLVVAVAFGFSFLMYMAVMWAGFYTFGGSSTGFVLNNYSSKDSLATIARLAIGLGILGCYPITFTALKDGIVDLMNVKEEERDGTAAKVSIPTFVLITAVSLVVKNVGLVVAFSGALIGAMLIYTVPAIMNICNIYSTLQGSKKVVSLSTSQKFDLILNYGMALLGVGIAVVGGYSTLMGAKH